MYRTSVIGMGYVGLCTAVCLANKGYKTIISTHDTVKADLVNKGTPPFHEPGLEKMLRKAVNKGCLKVVLDREEAIIESDIAFITVGTPSKPDGNISLRFVRSTAEEIGKALKKKDECPLLVMKSTVIPGTTERIFSSLVEKNSGKRCGIDFLLCANPEFTREGSAIYDTINPDRIVIGQFNEDSGDALENLYRDFYNSRLPPTIRTNLQTAELVKYASNAFLAMKVSFINTIAKICEKIPDVDVSVVSKGMGIDRRISRFFLNAGLGYGGSCLPKDVRALIAFSKGLGYDPTLIKAIEEVNDTQPYKAVELAKRLLGGLQGKRVAVLGLAFKPNTDDMREAVSIKVISKLLEEGASVVTYDPAAMSNAKRILDERVEYTSSAINCIKDADCCIVTTEWEKFKKLKPGDFIENMREPILIDGRRIYNPAEFREKLHYLGVGLG